MRSRFRYRSNLPHQIGLETLRSAFLPLQLVRVYSQRTLSLGFRACPNTSAPGADAEAASLERSCRCESFPVFVILEQTPDPRASARVRHV